MAAESTSPKGPLLLAEFWLQHEGIFFLIVNLNIQADNSLKDEKIDRHRAAVLTKFRQPHIQIYKDMKLFYQSRELEMEEVCGEFEHKNSLTNTAQKPASL